MTPLAGAARQKTRPAPCSALPAEFAVCKLRYMLPPRQARRSGERRVNRPTTASAARETGCWSPTG